MIRVFRQFAPSITRRAALVACVAFAGACVRYPAFDEYRTIRQEELISVQANTKDGVQTERFDGGVIQAVPLWLRVESTVRWRTYIEQVWAERNGTRPGTSGKLFFLVGGESLDFAATTTTLAPGGPYVFPYVDRDRYAKADHDWMRDEALTGGLQRVLDASAVDPATKATRLAAVRPALEIDEYERLVDPTWLFATSPFLVLGLDAVSWTGPLGANGQRATRIIPADSLPRNARDVGIWPFEVASVPYPIAPFALSGAFRSIRHVNDFALDSLRILGNWYRPADRAAWRARPLRLTKPARISRDASLKQLLPQQGGDVEGVFRTHEARLVETLDVAGVQSARVLLACWDPRPPHRPCFEVGRQYQLYFKTPNPDNSSRFLATTYDFRVLQRSLPVSALVGTGLIFLFLGASAY